MNQTISLHSLLSTLPLVSPAGYADQEISVVTHDSRQVTSSGIFVAIQGGSSDGHRFISAAIERGAVFVVGTQPIVDLPVPYLQVTDSRFALARLSAAFYGFPAMQLTVIGVTGTDGKTTTSNLIYAILKRAGIKVGMISTVNAVIGDQELDTGFHVTTPEAPDVQRYLSQMVAAGLTHVVLEVTSHGLAQQRAVDCAFDVGVVTNITHEHLDYHGSYEAYRSAKAILFQDLASTPQKKQGNLRVAILNQDDGSYAFLSTLVGQLEPGVKSLAYSAAGPADYSASQIQHAPAGLSFVVASNGQRQPIQTELVGDFNVSNCLAAFAACTGALGISPVVASAGLQEFTGIPGRMERIDLGQNFTAIVDFAHTPNALRRALQTARNLTARRVIAVFGSAGLRDKEKRRMMAEVSAELADITILTAEDPRTESLDGILEEMAQGARAKGALEGGQDGGQEGGSFFRVPDRAAAIRFALSLAQPGDLVMACGKGHEQSMCFGTTEYLWDDRTAMRAALAEYLGQPGPEMPYLPTQSPLE